VAENETSGAKSKGHGLSRRQLLVFGSAAALAAGSTGAIPSRASAVSGAPNLQNLDKSMPEETHATVGRRLAAAPGAWGGYTNGEIPVTAMTPVPAAVGQPYLKNDAAVAYFALSGAFEEHFGSPLGLQEGYRNRERQDALWVVYQNGGNKAAVPGTSIHGWGQACDFASNVNVGGSPQKIWMDANAPDYGWQPRGNDFGEAWHYEYDGSYNPVVASSVAVQGGNGTMWIWNGNASETGFSVNTGVPVVSGTSPAIAFNGSDLGAALVTTGNYLATWVGRAGIAGKATSASVTVMPGTSPAIVPLSDGRYAVAFQASTGELWTWRGIAGTTGTARTTGRGMAAGTSPSITTVGSGVSVAFQAPDGTLATWYGQPTETGQVRGTGVGMKAGTSPSITRVNGSTVAVAVQANTGSLWVWKGTPGASGIAVQAGLGMKAGTSPSITLLGTELAVAAQANTGELWTWHGAPGDSGVAGTTGVGMTAATSPSIAVAGNQVAVGVRANTGSLWTWAGRPGDRGSATAAAIGISSSPSVV
jgi:hypothetical protein